MCIHGTRFLVNRMIDYCGKKKRKKGGGPMQKRGGCSSRLTTQTRNAFVHIHSRIHFHSSLLTPVRPLPPSSALSLRLLSPRSSPPVSRRSSLPSASPSLAPSFHAPLVEQRHLTSPHPLTASPPTRCIPPTQLHMRPPLPALQLLPLPLQPPLVALQLLLSLLLLQLPPSPP